MGNIGPDISFEQLRADYTHALEIIEGLRSERDKARAQRDDALVTLAESQQGRARLRSDLDRCDGILTVARVALDCAGAPDCAKYFGPESRDPYEQSLRAGGRVLTIVERIDWIVRELRAARATVAELEAELPEENRFSTRLAEAEAARDRWAEIAMGANVARKDLTWGVVANAGRLSTTRRPRWAHVKEATGFGSTRARKLCRDAGFDPDEMVGAAAEEEEEADDG